MSEDLVNTIEGLENISLSPEQRDEIVHVTKGALSDLINKNNELIQLNADLKSVALDLMRGK
jgi:hypothetical protein